jgi:hypothetical protein
MRLLNKLIEELDETEAGVPHGETIRARRVKE